MKLTPISDVFDDKHNKWSGGYKEKSLFLDKELWAEAMKKKNKQTIKTDDGLAGKPKMNLYYNGLKPEHMNVEFGGNQKPFKVIY